MSRISKEWILIKRDKKDGDPKTASRRWIYLSIFICWLIDLFQWTQLPFVPNFLILCLVFWTIYQPQRIYYFLVFLLGILVDAGTGAIFGQNAFIFCLVVFCTELMSVRLEWLSPLSQTVNLLPIFLIPAVVMTIEGLLLNDFTFSWTWYYKAAVSTVIWPIWAWLLSGRFLVRKE